MKKIFNCPVNAYDCPYWKDGGHCAMVDEGFNPVEECDEAGYVFDKDDNPFEWEDEDGFRYDVYELLAQGYHFVDGEPVFPPFEAVD